MTTHNLLFLDCLILILIMLSVKNVYYIDIVLYLYFYYYLYYYPYDFGSVRLIRFYKIIINFIFLTFSYFIICSLM